MSYWVLNYLITAGWLLVLIAQAMRTSTQVVDETLILGKWSVAFTAVLGVWGLGGLIHLYLFTRTGIGRKIFRTEVLLTLISTVAFLGVAELAARQLDLFPANSLTSNLSSNSARKDPIFGGRFKSNALGHDADGWRNVKVPEDVDWLFLGDSMTYGSGVGLDEAYPYVVGANAGRQTYNLSTPGFGPAEYLHGYREYGRDLAPEIVTIGITFGNDLFDLTSVNHDRWNGLGIDTSMIVVDRSDPTNVRETFTSYLGTATVPPGFAERLFKGVRQRLNQNSALARAFVDPPGRIRREPKWFEAANVLSAEKTKSLPKAIRYVGEDPPFFVYSDELVRTVFTPTRRLIPVDLSFPTIRAAVDVTNEIIGVLASEVEADGGQLVVIFIPTKEEVYYQYLLDRAVDLPKSFQSLAVNTAEIKETFTGFIAQLGICLLDTTPVLSEAASQGFPLFFHDNDGHPAVIGHEVIAEYLTGELSRLEQGEDCQSN